MNKIEAILREEKLGSVKQALAQLGVMGLNVAYVTGRGNQLGRLSEDAKAASQADMVPKVKIDIVVNEADTEKAIQAIVAAARTGKIGDGKIFVTPVSQVIRVRTGERGAAAV